VAILATQQKGKAFQAKPSRRLFRPIAAVTLVEVLSGAKPVEGGQPKAV
jgi:hypothetical protein